MNIFTFVCAAVLFLVVAGCDYPYAPQPEPPLKIVQSGSKESLRVFPINGTMQICNPSISQDTVHFPGCMLWLNFGGALAVSVPDVMKNFGEIAEQHDRLTIVDTANTVAWFMKLDELGAAATEEFQDPEWSAHPDFVVALLSSDNRREWACHVICPVNRATIKIVDSGLEETSTPHLWVAPSGRAASGDVQVEYDDDHCANSASVKQYFGTDSVKLVVSLKTGGAHSLFMRDFRDDSGLVPLERPADRDGWNLESPLISPDGNWIVYNAYKTEKYYEVYLQKLTADAKPVLLFEDASDPHWWVNPSDPTLTYIIYEEVPGWTLVNGDLADERYLESGELGSTSFQLFRLFAEGQTHMSSIQALGSPERIVNLPTKGGLSPDGRYLCTGFDRAFMIGLP